MQLFTKVCDVTSAPTHLVFERLRDLFERGVQSHNRELSVEEETVREKLDLLASFTPDGAEERLRYSHRERLGIHEVLYDFRDHIDICVEDILDVIPVIQPRYFSVCNACDSTSSGILGTSARIPVTVVEICVAVVEFKTLYGRTRYGLASTFLSKRIPGEILNNVWLERGFNQTLARGIESCTSAVLIGPGTGISPLRAIIHKYDLTFLLLTGFRQESVDFLFQSDIEDRFGKDVTTLVAWSRPTIMDRHSPFSYSMYSSDSAIKTPSTQVGRKTWVQDLVETEPNILRDFLHRRNIMIVISGRSHPMPYQVTDALRALVGDDRINHLQKTGQIVFDTWG
jgi:sulfite reductase alpha subunit-like flavoprotein